jgi:hypothetical protein
MTKTANKRKYKKNRANERFDEYKNQRVMVHNGKEFIFKPKFDA